jgi:hypothetical protein
MSDDSSTGFSTGKCGKLANPYLGRLLATHPYMGVLHWGDFPTRGHFSTSDANYPQIIATYPQLPYPEGA